MPGKHADEVIVIGVATGGGDLSDGKLGRVQQKCPGPLHPKPPQLLRRSAAVELLAQLEQLAAAHV